MVIIHTSTNDMPSKVNTLQKIRNVISAIKGDDSKGKRELAISSVIYQEGQKIEDQIKERNAKLESFCKGIGIRFTNRLW